MFLSIFANAESRLISSSLKRTHCSKLPTFRLCGCNSTRPHHHKLSPKILCIPIVHSLQLADFPLTCLFVCLFVFTWEKNLVILPKAKILFYCTKKNPSLSKILPFTGHGTHCYKGPYRGRRCEHSHTRPQVLLTQWSPNL